MKFLTTGLRNIGVLLPLMLMVLLTCSLSVSANFYEKTNLTTFQTQTIFPNEPSASFRVRSNPLGADVLKIRSNESPNLFTTFTEQKMSRRSAINRPFDCDSAEPIRAALNFSENSITSTFQNFPTIEAKSLKTFFGNHIWKTDRQYSVNEPLKNWRTFGKQPETNSKTSMIVPWTRSSTQASSGSGFGVTSDQWLRQKSNPPNIGRSWIHAQRKFAVELTVKRSVSLPLKPPLNG